MIVTGQEVVMGEVAWWMVRISPELGSGGGAAPAVAHVIKDDVERLTAFTADTLTLVQVRLEGCGLDMKSPTFYAPLLLSGHQLAFGTADRPMWEHLLNSDRSFSDALSTVHVFPSARSGKICAVHGHKTDKCPGRLNHTQRRRFWAERVWANGNRRPKHE